MKGKQCSPSHSTSKLPPDGLVSFHSSGWHGTEFMEHGEPEHLFLRGSMMSFVLKHPQPHTQTAQILNLEGNKNQKGNSYWDNVLGVERHPNLASINGLIEPVDFRRLISSHCFPKLRPLKKKRKINWAESLLCEMSLGIRISLGLRAIESLPSRRFKVDFRVVEFIDHRIFERPSKENFTVN